VPIKIKANSLTDADLVALNDRIVERLKFLNRAWAHAQMLAYKIGDRVSLSR
jgi:hypothetical protein